MTITTNANFDTYHDAANKTPMYVAIFYGVSAAVLEEDGTPVLDEAGEIVTEEGSEQAFCNYVPASPTREYRQLLKSISGLSQTVNPERGQSSIGGLKLSLNDTDAEITAMMAIDSTQLHRRRVEILAGYRGMAEADMIKIFTGWVTGNRRSNDNTGYDISITDPQKFMQRYIFRDAADDNIITVQGNPINILLSILASTGAGTNGTYDSLAEEDGLGIDEDYIDVTKLEALRDQWFPADSNYMKFKISEKIKAKEFIEKQICQPLGCYPAVGGDGKFYLIIYKPPFDETSTALQLDETNIIGIPKWDQNMSAMINEIEWQTDFDGTDYLTITRYEEATSINNRGAGVSPLTIKSMGIRSTISPGSLTGRAGEIIPRRTGGIFGRWADPPPSKLTVECFFSRWIAEAGDIVEVTHSAVPNVEDGTIGITQRRMEVFSRSPDWVNGKVKLSLIDTGFDKGNYAAVGVGHTIGGGYLISP